MQKITMDEIAARAGVSRAAVSFALRGSSKVSAKTTELILQVARELGYRPNLNASRLARSDFSTFGLLVSDLHNPIMADIMDGFVLSDEESESEVYLASGFNSTERERATINSFLSHRVKGIVLAGSLLESGEIIQLSKMVPTIVVGRRIAGLDCVLVDEEAGGRLAAKHLLDLGHRKLAHVDGGKGAGALRRKRAFMKKLSKAGDVELTLHSGDYTQISGYRAATEMFAQTERPTGIFAANDLMALGVLGAAREAGLRPGSDFALIGFDDISLAAYDYISLTTISYSRTEMGQIARRLLLRRLSDAQLEPETVELVPNLIVRRSTTTS
ncbi:LacI family transcriptional regulator [Agrobacterium tumefaciens]|uniref:LacI family DNA-binding transcriptional regulator n=1 Tax=Agrobacterium tumefaciens TaxID=358 RepID=UPI0015722DDF|nr:LacI family DNA-binding transcriptional regulator [Agrobacterium tumefaciens]NTE56432.1 LacI family transcriptional regulator [Agrobacterium tumefaciens]NTE74400.1 LacI family transcriptional regulator [Agrobacterium tumefaciens]